MSVSEEFETQVRRADDPSSDTAGVVEQFQRATAIGFHEAVTEAAGREVFLKIARAQRLLMRMVFDRSASPESRHAEDPVLTYAGFGGRLNAGGANPVPVHKITAVTVSPAYRRKGLLSQQIAADLREAAEQYPLAVLTASEAGIYGRFGFGAASYRAAFTVHCRQGLELRFPVPGRVEEVTGQRMDGAFQELAERTLHSSFGAVDAAPFDEGYLLGQWDGWDTLTEPKNLRWAAYRDEQQQIAGMVCYKYADHQGADTMQIRGLVASTARARAALLQHLANHDLIEQVRGSGPVHEPLRLQLRDERQYTVRSLEDSLWLRVLNPVAALEARGYVNDGRLLVNVADRLGIAEGIYLLEVTSGQPTVRRVAAEEYGELPMLSLDVAELGRLYLGQWSIGDLLEAGAATWRTGADESSARRIFETHSTPYTPFEF